MKEDKNASARMMMINQIIFFLSYTVFRMIMFPWILFQMCRTAYIFFWLVSFFRKIGIIICCLQACLILALNLFWYKIIVKKIVKLVSSGEA